MAAQEGQFRWTSAAFVAQMSCSRPLPAPFGRTLFNDTYSTVEGDEYWGGELQEAQPHGINMKGYRVDGLKGDDPKKNQGIWCPAQIRM